MVILAAKRKVFLWSVHNSVLGSYCVRSRGHSRQTSLQTISSRPTPKTGKRFRAFLGLAGCYRKFVKVPAVSPHVSKDLENGSSTTKTNAEAGTAEFLIQLETRRSIKVLGSCTFIGLAIVFFAGVCFYLFSPAFNLATNDQWHTLKEGVPHLVVFSGFQFMGGQATGYAAADAVQAPPLVSTFWGVCLFGTTEPGPC
ncbi:hypothetical protein ACLOJK_021597 [Asimina triloba]